MKIKPKVRQNPSTCAARSEQSLGAPASFILRCLFSRRCTLDLSDFRFSVSRRDVFFCSWVGSEYFSRGPFSISACARSFDNKTCSVLSTCRETNIYDVLWMNVHFQSCSCRKIVVIIQEPVLFWAVYTFLEQPFEHICGKLAKFANNALFACWKLRVSSLFASF